MHFELVRKLLYELIHVILFLLELITDGLLELDVEFLWDFVVFLDFIKDFDFLLVVSIGLVIVLDDRSQGAVSKGKGENAYNHYNRAEHFLEVVVARNVTIAYCRDGGDGPVERDSVEVRVGVAVCLVGLHPSAFVVFVVE